MNCIRRTWETTLFFLLTALKNTHTALMPEWNVRLPFIVISLESIMILKDSYDEKVFRDVEENPEKKHEMKYQSMMA